MSHGHRPATEEVKEGRPHSPVPGEVPGHGETVDHKASGSQVGALWLPPGRCAGGRGSHTRPPGRTAEARSSAPFLEGFGDRGTTPGSLPRERTHRGRSWSPAGGRGHRSPRSSGGRQPGTCRPACRQMGAGLPPCACLRHVPQAGPQKSGLFHGDPGHVRTSPCGPWCLPEGGRWAPLGG